MGFTRKNLIFFEKELKFFDERAVIIFTQREGFLVIDRKIKRLGSVVFGENVK